jgi:hypothetical protein
MLAPSKTQSTPIEIIERLALGKENEDDLEILRGAARRYLSPGGGSLEAELGIFSARGGMPCRRAASKRRRNAALRSLAAFYQNEPDAAARLHLDLSRYAARSWARDRLRSSPPSSYDVRHELFFAVMATGERVVGLRQLRRIIGEIGDIRSGLNVSGSAP